MRLFDALRLTSASRLALTGSGGKSSALFQLAKEYLISDGFPDSRLTGSSRPKRILLAATTHLALDQVQIADHHIILEANRPLVFDDIAFLNGIILFTGPPVERRRTAGVLAESIAHIKNIADQFQVPLMIEADGSRQLPLKAPGPDEPVVPDWVDTVVVVAGLSGLDRPLSHETVFREELFARLAGLSLGQMVEVGHLARVLNHPDGGLKAIPDHARRVLLLNQAAGAELQAAASRIADMALPAYESIVIANLPYYSEASDRYLTNSVITVHEQVAGVILAAGGADRFGKPKQILEWHGQPLVRHVAGIALAANLSPIIVVTGNKAVEVEAAVEGMPVISAYNPEWKSGQASSVRTGISALPHGVGAAIFLLADQPLVTVSLLRSLVELHALELPPIVAPLVEGKRANPVLFDRITFPDLKLLTGDVGGRSLFSRYSPAWLPWDDRAVLIDIDTPDDYCELLSSSGGFQL